MGCPGNYCDRLSIAYPVLKANPCFSCHPERSEGSGEPDEEILRCAQDDSQAPSQVRSREAFSPNVYSTPFMLAEYNMLYLS